MELIGEALGHGLVVLLGPFLVFPKVILGETAVLLNEGFEVITLLARMPRLPAVPATPPPILHQGVPG